MRVARPRSLAVGGRGFSMGGNMATETRYDLVAIRDFSPTERLIMCRRTVSPGWIRRLLGARDETATLQFVGSGTDWFTLPHYADPGPMMCYRLSQWDARYRLEGPLPAK